MRMLFDGILMALTLGYPFAIYFCLDRIGPKFFVLILFAIFSLRVVFVNQSRSVKEAWVLLGFMGSFSITVYFLNSAIGLLFYPVIINIFFFCIFAYSLVTPPTVIERLARIKEPDLPGSAIAYTRKVTLVWCVFFAANGMIAAYTAVYSSLKIWSLYNGFISYILIGLVFLIEYAVRIHVRRKGSL